MVLSRELPPTIRVTGAERLSAALVLDVDTGLIRGVAAGETTHEALCSAMGTALATPAANLPAGRPGRVLCPVGSAAAVGSALVEAGIAMRAEEVHPGAEAEDTFDSLVAHLSGRSQPSDPPTPDDWHLLLEQALAFRQAEPWTRWSDEQHLLLTLATDRGSAPYLAIIMGQAGVQHGLALYPGHEPPELQPDSDDPQMPESVVLLLDPAEQLPPDVTAKAHRYAWPKDDPLMPACLAFGPDGPEEISRDDAHLLTVALAAVSALDQRGLRPATDPAPATGSVRLSDGDLVSFTIHHQQPAPDLEGPSLRLHVAGSDLVSPGTAVTLGHLNWDAIPELRKKARLHRPAPADAPKPTGAEVPLLVLSPEPLRGTALAAGLAELDPYGASAVAIDNDEHAIVIAGGAGAELALTLPTSHPALAAFQRRLRQTRGRHLIMVADLNTARGDGTVYGLFECHQPVAPRPPAPRPKKKPKTKRR